MNGRGAIAVAFANQIDPFKNNCKRGLHPDQNQPPFNRDFVGAAPIPRVKAERPRYHWPMKSTQAATARRQIIRELAKVYPDARCELKYSNPLELLVATILSARCSDKQVNLVTPKLFAKYHAAGDYAAASLGELEQELKSIGLYRNKARNLKACCQALVDRHRGQVPQTMEELTALDGVGRKTANVVLGNAYGLNFGVVVDTHVTRLAERLGLSRQTDPAKIEMDLMGIVPREQWTQLSHWLIWHGRRRCYARNPDCVHCEIQSLCPAKEARSARVKAGREQGDGQ
jgi:endonuclease III